MVGSLFSKRPRVADSNCKTSCFACAFFSLGFIAFCSGNGTAFFFGVIKGGSGGWTIGGGGDGAISSSGAGGSKGIRSIGGAVSIDGSGKMSIFGGSGSGV